MPFFRDDDDDDFREFVKPIKPLSDLIEEARWCYWCGLLLIGAKVLDEIAARIEEGPPYSEELRFNAEENYENGRQNWE